MKNINIAKGSWQQQIWKDLLSGECITNPLSFIRGNAARFMGKYQSSFYSLLGRAEKAGYNISVERGPRGGYWKATYQLISCPIQN